MQQRREKIFRSTVSHYVLTYVECDCGGASSEPNSDFAKEHSQRTRDPTVEDCKEYCSRYNFATCGGFTLNDNGACQFRSQIQADTLQSDATREVKCYKRVVEYRKINGVKCGLQGAQIGDESDVTSVDECKSKCNEEEGCDEGAGCVAFIGKSALYKSGRI